MSYNVFKTDVMTGGSLTAKNKDGNELKDPIVRATWNSGGGCETSNYVYQNEAAPTYAKYDTTNTNSDPDGILKHYIYPQSTGTTYQFSNFCQYRLPCGYCERLMRDCPKWHPDNMPHLNSTESIVNDKNVSYTANTACGGWKDEG